MFFEVAAIDLYVSLGLKRRHDYDTRSRSLLFLFLPSAVQSGEYYYISCKQKITQFLVFAYKSMSSEAKLEFTHIIRADMDRFKGSANLQEKIVVFEHIFEYLREKRAILWGRQFRGVFFITVLDKLCEFAESAPSLRNRCQHHMNVLFWDNTVPERIRTFPSVSPKLRLRISLLMADCGEQL